MNENKLNAYAVLIAPLDLILIIEKFFLHSFDEPALQGGAGPSPDAAGVVEGGDVVTVLRCE